MQIREVAIIVESAEFLTGLMAVLQELQVPFDPCAGEPKFTEDENKALRVHFLAIPRIERELTERNYKFEVVKEYADVPDPRVYTSQNNRYEEKLRKLQQASGSN